MYDMRRYVWIFLEEHRSDYIEENLEEWLISHNSRIVLLDTKGQTFSPSIDAACDSGRPEWRARVKRGLGS